MNTFFHELWIILLESSIWLLVGFAIAGAIHAIIPREWMLKHLSGGGFVPVAKAALLGIPLPLCSCSVIPVAAGLRSQGASKGASAAFAISTPQTGEESIPITWALFGPIFALIRPIVAVITGLSAGLLIDALCKDKACDSRLTPDQSNDSIEDPKATSLSIMNPDANSAVEQVESKNTNTGSSCCSSKQPVQSSCCSSSKPEPEPQPTKSSCCSLTTPEPTSSSCCSSNAPTNSTSIGEKISIGFKHGFGTMAIDLALWLSIGLILAAIIGSTVSADWVSDSMSIGILPKLLMLLVGIPLYICATSSTPLAWSLVAVGVSPGAALVMLLSGPATNVATMSWIIKDLGIRALIIYLTTISTIALLAGILFDAFFINSIQLADKAHLHEHGSSGFGIKELAAIVFTMLMAWALGMKMRTYMNKKGWGTTNPTKSGGCCSSKTSSKTSCGCS